MTSSRSTNMLSEFEQFMAEVANLSPPEKLLEEPEYRLYYDDTGFIRLATQRNHPESSEYEYMVAEKEIWQDHIHYRVNLRTLKLEKVVMDTGISVQLVKSTKGYQVVKGHAGLILEQEDNWTGDAEYYAANI